MSDDSDVTQSFHVVEEEQAAPPPPPSGPPPGAWLDDVWPWLAALAVLAVAGLLVWLFVLRDRGSSKHVVPAVVGMRQQAAIAKLTGDGYAVKAFLQPAKRPRGIVDSQAPGGGSQLPKGGTVTLHISNGQTPPTDVTTTTTATTTVSKATTAATTTAAAPTTQVPDVTGEDLPSATGDVEAAGFLPDSEPVSSGGQPGTVVQQTPAGGGQANTGTPVMLDVVFPSNRPAVQIPNVVGKSAADARAALAQSKLTFKTSYAKGKPGVVLSQSATGSAPAYTQVALTVGR